MKTTKKSAPAAAATNRSTTEADLSLGRRIRAARLERGMSQTHLAEQLGITFQQVQKYERGVNRVASARLKDVARVLGKPIDWFMDSNDPPESGRAVMSDEIWEALGTSDGILLISTFARIRSPALRQRVVSLVATLADALEEGGAADHGPRTLTGEKGRPTN